MQKHVKERHFVNLPKHSKMDFGYNKKSASADITSAEADFFVSGVLNFSFYVKNKKNLLLLSGMIAAAFMMTGCVGNSGRMKKTLSGLLKWTFTCSIIRHR